ncbi:MAG: SCO family protein [Hydrogenophaga sp.]
MPQIPLCVQMAPSPGARRCFLTALLAAGLAPWLVACDRADSSAAPADFKGIDITGADYAQEFALTDMRGAARSLTDFRGKAVLLYFGFVQCPDVCPTALARTVEVLHLLGPEAAKRVQLLFITVDPERDTPELLREYMAAFDPSFVALTGSLDQIKTTADAFRVYFKKVPTGSSYTMDHTALTYLFDPQGKVRAALRHEQTASDYAADVQKVLAEMPA